MGKQVLIVNYEPKSLSKLNQLVVEMGHEVQTARNGKEALESVSKSVPDLVIMDPMLPKLSGFEVAQRLNSEHPEIPIIMVTSVYKGNRYRTEAMTKYGVKEYLEEPFEEEVLKSHVSRFLKDDQTATPKKHKKASTKRRLEEILEETLSGRVPGSTSTPKSKTEPADEPVMTSEEIFGDVIQDVEESAPDAGAAPMTESVEKEVDKKLEETLPRDKKEKEKKVAKAEPKKPVEPEPAPQAEEKPEPEPAEEPVMEHQEAVIESKPPKPEEDKGDKEPETLKGPDGEGIEYGSYVLLEKVATGGMADLFKAKRRGVQGFQKIVAIKRILSHLVDNEDFVTMFIDEAKLAAQLNHPNIAQIYDLGKIDNSFYIAMEYVEGYDLRNILKECNKEGIQIPEPLVLFVASKILSALDYAHRKKGLDMKDLQIVHRDISPQNILISKGGDVKLVDFGIAKAATKASQTQAGALKGKLLYMSPEQAYGKQIDSRSDLFSLGSVMYESLTGTKCFLADSEISILERVRNVQYTPLSDTDADVSEDAENLIAQALSKDIDVRYQSAKEMEADIHDLLEALPFAVSERILARFVNALYEGDNATIEEINNKYAVARSAEPVAPVETGPKREAAAPAKPDPSATVRIDAAEEVGSFTEEDLEPAEAPVESGKSDTGTMIMPDLEDVERAEDELIEQYGDSGGGSKTGLWVALVVVCVIVGIVGWYMMKGRQVTPADSGSTTTQTTPQTVNETTVPEEGLPADSEAVQTPETGEELPIQLNEDGTIPSDFDKEKLVEELMRQKLAEAERAQQQTRAEQPASQSQPPVVREPAEPAPTESETATQDQDSSQTTEQQPAATQPAPAVTEPEQTTPGQPVEEPVAQPETQPAGDTQTEQPQDQPAEETTAEETEPTEEPAPQTSEPETQPQPEPEQPAVTQPEPEPEIPQTKEGDLVPLVEGEVTFPEAIRQVTPTVTAMARKMRVHGTIVAQALIDENGDVVETRIIRNIPGRHGLDRSVMNALKEWKFKPAVKDGVKVKVYFTQAFTF